MQGALYIIPFSDVAVTAAQDLFEVAAAASRPLKLHEAKVTQRSDAGDSEAEMLRFAFKRGVGITSGSGGSSPTEVPLNSDAPSFAGTSEANNTTQAVAGGGTLTTMWEEAAHVANGLHYLPAPEHRPVFKDDETFILALETAPADSLTMSGHLLVEEM